MAPTFYINKIQMTDKIASLKHLTTGHLAALNVQPYAAVKNNIYPIEDRLEDTINIGQSTPELEKLLEARPELIIMREHTHGDLSLKEPLYNQIAPTITLPYHQDWRIHLQSIVKAIGKASAANSQNYTSARHYRDRGNAQESCDVISGSDRCGSCPQIQPHFIFNALSAATALSDINLDKMRELLYEFSNFLRYKFKFEDMGGLVPIETELSLIRSYLYIEKVRFEERLEVVWELATTAGKKG